MKSHVMILLGATGAAGLLFAIIASYSASGLAEQPTANNAGAQISQGQGMMIGNNQSASFIYKLENKYRNYTNGVMTVHAGAGSTVAPLTWFFPRFAEIKVGETVTWVNPTKAGEPHTVTFVMNGGSLADFAAPFVLPDASTALTPADPTANAEALTVPGPNNSSLVVAVNNRSLSPAVLAADGSVKYLEPNSTYTMDGTEKYINSGWLWPSGQEPPGFPPINSFSVKFTKAGTYDYLCEVHPWMAGEVIVK